MRPVLDPSSSTTAVCVGPSVVTTSVSRTRTTGTRSRARAKRELISARDAALGTILSRSKKWM